MIRSQLSVQVPTATGGLHGTSPHTRARQDHSLERRHAVWREKTRPISVRRRLIMNPASSETEESLSTPKRSALEWSNNQPPWKMATELYGGFGAQGSYLFSHNRRAVAQSVMAHTCWSAGRREPPPSDADWPNPRAHHTRERQDHSPERRHAVWREKTRSKSVRRKLIVNPALTRG